MASSNGWSLTSAIKRVFEKLHTQSAILPTRSSRLPLRRKPLFEGLEHRLLLSADPVGALGASTDPADTNEPVVSAPLSEGQPAAPAIQSAPPVAADDLYVVKEDVVLDLPLDQSVLVNDAGDTPLNALLGKDADNGTLVLNPDGTFKYTPNADYVGLDSFTYYAVDATGQRSAEARVQLSIEGMPDAPVAHDDTLRTAVDTPLSISFEDLLGNDFDADGDSLQVAPDYTQPAHGEVVTVHDSNGMDVGYEYHPDAGFSGEDSFSYHAVDAEGLVSAAATVTIRVTTNAAPVANPDRFSTGANTPLTVTAGQGLLVNDSDADGDALSATLVTQAAGGHVTVNADGSFVYTPDAGFVGTDNFTYRASDGHLASDALVTITVQPPTNSAPVANSDIFSTDEDTALVIAADHGLLTNDSDANGDPLVAKLVSGPAHGKLQLLEDGSFTYTPTANFNGADSFTYKASDGKLESAVTTVSLNVKAVNDAPKFSSTPTTTFTIDADAASFDGDGVFRVAGAPGQPGMMAGLDQPITVTGAVGQSVNVQFDWTFREALYNNEVGIYRVSDTDGRVGNLLPGDAGYAKAALAPGNAQVYSQAAQPLARFATAARGRRLYAFYVIQNGKTSSFLANNPNNVVGGGPLAFFSIAAANPDGFDHLHAEIQPQTGTLNLRWEDLTRGGDADYNDVVMTAKGLSVSSDDVMYVYNASAQDVDGDALTYRLADGPQGAYIDANTGVLRWAAAPGCFHFVIEALDGNGPVARQAFDLTVDTRTTDLVVKGTGANDRIEVWEHDGGLVTVRVNDIARTYSHVSSLRVDALGGDDQVVLRSLTMGATVDGGDGNDCIDASAVTQVGVVLYGGAGDDRLTGGAGNDRMDGGSGDDELNGGCGNDLLVGGQGKDCLNGGDGNDLLDGGSDNDALRGGKGNDLLVADAGDDYLKGEDGNDILVGGTGNDSSEGNYGVDLIVDGPGCDTNGYVSSQDRVVDGTHYGIPTTLPAQPPGPIVDWSSRYVALVGALQQFGDHPSNPQWWQDFVTNLGKTEADANPNSRIRVVSPGSDS